jgi:hypothetical protein
MIGGSLQQNLAAANAAGLPATSAVSATQQGQTIGPPPNVATPITAATGPSNNAIPTGTQNQFISSIPYSTSGSNTAVQPPAGEQIPTSAFASPSTENAYTLATQQAAQAGVTPTQTLGSGSFSVAPEAPATVLAPPSIAGGINSASNVIPYMTAQTNQANAQQYQNLQQGLGALSSGYAGAEANNTNQENATKSQFDAINQGMQSSGVAQEQAAGLTGNTVSGSVAAQSKTTRQLGVANLKEQMSQQQATLDAAGNTALAQYLATPQYANDNSTLLQAMEAQSSFNTFENQSNKAANAAAQQQTIAEVGVGVAGAAGLAGFLSSSAGAGLLTALASL